MILLQGQNKSNEFYKMIMYIGKYPWMPIDDDRGRPRSVPDRPIRPSPSRVWPSRPVLSNFGRTGRLRTLATTLLSGLFSTRFIFQCQSDYVRLE
jgi:hypothetical protein